MSNSFGGGTSSGSRSVTARPEAMWAANNFTDYLKSLNTSTVDNTYQNIANNAYELSSQLPNYVYSVDGSDAARQRMEGGGQTEQTVFGRYVRVEHQIAEPGIVGWQHGLSERGFVFAGLSV